MNFSWRELLCNQGLYRHADRASVRFNSGEVEHKKNTGGNWYRSGWEKVGGTFKVTTFITAIK